MKKEIKIALGVLGAIMILALGIGYAVKPLRVNTLEIKKIDLSNSFEETGDFVGTREVKLSPEVGGKIIFIAQENQQVKKGDPLAEIQDNSLDYQKGDLQGKLQSLQGQRALASPKLYDSQIQLQTLAIETAKENLGHIDKDVVDMKSLLESGAVAQKDYDELIQKQDQAQRNLEAEEAKLKLLKEQSQTSPGTKQLYDGQEKSLRENLAQIENRQLKQKINSPIDGIVTWTGTKKGETVVMGQGVIAVTNPGDLLLEVWVLTDDALNVNIGHKVKIRQEGSDQDRYGIGEVYQINQFAEKRISPLGLDEKRVKISVKITDQGTLKQQLLYSAKATFIIKEEKEALAVPKASLFPMDSKGEAVWVIKDGKAHIQSVEKGFDAGTQVQILKGLKEGDVIITDPGTSGLKEGKRVAQ